MSNTQAAVWQDMEIKIQSSEEPENWSSSLSIKAQLLRLNGPALPVQNLESTKKKARKTARTDRQSDKLCLMSTLIGTNASTLMWDRTFDTEP